MFEFLQIQFFFDNLAMSKVWDFKNMFTSVEHFQLGAEKSFPFKWHEKDSMKKTFESF